MLSTGCVVQLAGILQVSVSLLWETVPGPLLAAVPGPLLATVPGPLLAACTRSYQLQLTKAGLVKYHQLRMAA